MSKMTDPKWHLRLLDIANQVSQWSKDPNCGVGAVVVSPDGRQVSWGFNGLVRGPDSPELLRAEDKNDYMVHAELNAILNCHVRPIGWTLCCTKYPCLSCANAIIQAGIVQVVTTGVIPSSKWIENQMKAHAQFESAGVNVHVYDVKAII